AWAYRCWERQGKHRAGVTAYRQWVKMSTTTEVAKTPAERPQNGAFPALRARVTNHRDLLPGMKGTSSAARRFRDLVNAFVIDMGGLDQCSEIKLGLLRRLAATTVQAEMLEAKMVNGEQVDVATLCTLASTAMRLSSRLGIERVPKDTGITLGDLLRDDLRQ